VKVRGERLYLAARRGEAPEPDERAIRIYDLTASYGALPELELDLTVSRGTYVRTLAHDLGEALGCGAHLVSLRRIASGPFRVDEALSPEPTLGTEAAEFRARAKPPAEAVPHLPRATLTHEESSKLRHGRAPVLAAERIEPAPNAFPVSPDEVSWPLALFTPDGELLALAEAPGAPEPSAPRHAGVSSAALPLSLLRVFP
jgi:tRNA pseudouridine55 synthase